MPPPPSTPPAPPEPTPRSAEVWLDRLEQALLQADLAPETSSDATDWRRALQRLASSSGRAAPRTRDIAAALLALTVRLDAGTPRPTSAMLDLMLRSTEALRALQDASTHALPAEDLDDLLLELQAQTRGPRPAAAAGAAAPDEESVAFPAETGDEAPPWPVIDTLLAGLGPLAEALAELAEALHRPPAATDAAHREDDASGPHGADGRALGRPLGRAQTSLRALCAAAQALKATHAHRLPGVPDLQEVLVLRAGRNECLVPANAVVGCHPGTGAAIEGELDLAVWLAGTAPPTEVGAPTDASRMRVVVAHGSATSTWVVDEVMPPRIIAVQSLARHFRAVPGVAGTAVIGADRLLLVLDPATAGQDPVAAPSISAAAPAGSVPAGTESAAPAASR